MDAAVDFVNTLAGTIWIVSLLVILVTIVVLACCAGFVEAARRAVRWLRKRVRPRLTQELPFPELRGLNGLTERQTIDAILQYDAEISSWIGRAYGDVSVVSKEKT